VCSSDLTTLFEREERQRQAPFGQALDIGCGSGIWSVKLARRGWQVTGVDNVPKAIDRARERAREAGVEVRFVQGDATNLESAGLATGYDFLLDVGCFHGLTDEERAAEGRGVNALAAPGATMLMLAFQPGRRKLLPRGASLADIQAAFPGWTVSDEGAADTTGAPPPVQRAEPHYYRLSSAASRASSPDG